MSKSPDKIESKLIDELIKLRKEQGLSHEVLASKAKLHRSSISLIESKKRSPTLKSCVKIAQALGVNLSQLLEKSE